MSRVIIGLVNYGIAGNIFNIKKAIEVAGANVRVIETMGDFNQVDKIVLPGVGSFDDAMAELKNDGILEKLKECLVKKPSLGICLGMQIMTRSGFEFKESDGLGIIQGRATKMNLKHKLPHIGWAPIQIVRHNPILKNVKPDDEFYFFHSLEVINSEAVSAYSEYNDYRFASAIEKDGKLFGLQFHPEKSREAGIDILKNFCNL